MNTAPFFDFYYRNAEVNCILIMDCNGVVLDVNEAFTNNFGYKKDEIRGKNFSVLFNESDNEKNKPRVELGNVLSKGQSHDENYVINRDGHQIWCTGEALLIGHKEGEQYIVKDIVNLQAKRELQLLLKSTEELLERMFESSHDIPMMILDGAMKIETVNTAFLKLFEIIEAPISGCRLSDINHPFWHSQDVKDEVRKVLFTNKPLARREFLLTTKSAVQKVITLDSRIVNRGANKGRGIFIMIEDVTV